MANIKPSEFGGHGRKAGQHGGLVEEFASFCPPDIQPDTRVLGLIGVSDYAGKASPKQDGWFFSDGFAWMWLLANTGKFRYPHPKM